MFRLILLVSILTVIVPICDRRAARREPAVSPHHDLGLFTAHTDIGTLLHPSSSSYDRTTKTYTLSASGANMWFARDDFHFVWKQLSGDVSLTADIAFPKRGKDPHRKACLMIRQSLDPDSAYVDVALHGDGLTSLQFRDIKGAATHEIQANIKAPKRLRLEKRGAVTILSLAAEGQDLTYSGASMRISFQEPFYVGLGVCAHDKDAIEIAIFSNVELTTPAPLPAQPILYSTLETQSIASTDRRVVCTAPVNFEAPNWSHDGKTLIYNSGGKLYRLPVTGGRPEVIDTGFANRCNNDHGLSPDGTQLVFSDQSQDRRQSLIYTLPATGGTPRLVTKLAPSYWHGWSPDGKTLAYCAQRNGDFDVYTIPVAGGEERRLTTTPGLDDGPDYTADGQWIYWNSERTGLMKIWRMHPDGTNQEQVTTDPDWADWFPHPSPDGKWLVFLSYDKSVKGHPANHDVALRLMPLTGGTPKILTPLFGGQGTINVPSWSPDSKHIAFVSYRLLEK